MILRSNDQVHVNHRLYINLPIIIVYALYYFSFSIIPYKKNVTIVVILDQYCARHLVFETFISQNSSTLSYEPIK
ncbi:hypothetical protein RhiirA1_149112 [Rhizophagus irregularis]|uniref:Uncharacterized protein n=1 Tax=Rhizophagus irregularis TaxID=588596 RepID=A0A2N0RY97_9GLOM|nr:hypothetical protein RhiirA1_149112 [Rhizophagus irregularis]